MIRAPLKEAQPTPEEAQLMLRFLSGSELADGQYEAADAVFQRFPNWKDLPLVRLAFPR